MKMQGFADQERGFSDGIGGAMGEGQLRLDKTAYRVTDEIEQRH